MSKNQIVNWRKLEMKERIQREQEAFAELITKPINKRKGQKLPTIAERIPLKMKGRSVFEFIGGRVETITAIYTAKGRRIPLPNKAYKFLMWRDEGK